MSLTKKGARAYHKSAKIKARQYKKKAKANDKEMKQRIERREGFRDALAAHDKKMGRD